MEPKNTSDSIEAYIKKRLAQAGFVELKRSEVAASFEVVPSQINYVIKTRFTESRGYVVESKRGGGGYIRIDKIDFSDHHHQLEGLRLSLGNQVSQTVFTDIIQMLFEQKLMTEREGNLILAMSTNEVLGAEADKIRANSLRRIIQQLDRKE
ncbi:CtsR family transcriptional regulator [Streptococcus moroccensis]|uniref:Transcriptional regulator CtsR n=1 Tax=Streptococcus moroccensis TaxID=1451356 RepID=A0ABT9YQU7_9STRE|nr:CtsR family transcriptional regulator [Streptococcus moroccensis]MDQ0221962.1 transcriptional regulator CtsR [Streptococcus moroccensis]